MMTIIEQRRFIIELWEDTEKELQELKANYVCMCTSDRTSVGTYIAMQERIVKLENRIKKLEELRIAITHMGNTLQSVKETLLTIRIGG